MKNIKFKSSPLLIAFINRYLPDHAKNGIALLPCIYEFTVHGHVSRIMRKPDFCLGENKGADQLRGNREADQRLCFRYSDSTIPLLLKS